MERVSSVTRRLPRNASTNPIFDHILKPILRAYIFGHVSTTGPKLVGIILALLGGKKDIQRHLEKLQYIIKSSVGPFRFPAFCASLVAIYSTLSVIFIGLLRQWSLRQSDIRLPVSRTSQVRVARLLAALIATWTTFPMVNRGNARFQRQRARSLEAVPRASNRGDPNLLRESTDQPEDEDEDYAGNKFRGTRLAPLAGRTLDLTILASVRAIETLVWHAWRRKYGSLSSPQTSRSRLPRSSRLAAFVGEYSDSAVFIASCYVIMFAWFYSPDSLPRSYRRWIGQAADVDSRLVEVLRKVRWGSYVYGVDTGEDVLEGMCRDFNWPLSWADPTKTIPVPCEMVHQGTGRSCHWHKLAKFWRTWWFAMRMYLPLQLALRMRKPSVEGLKRAVIEASRSSAFLGAFVTLFYYGVCMSRTVVGPKLFSLDTVSRQDWDAGYCVGAGSALCGWSVLIEPAKRRQELSLFVAPRAASVFLPRRYERKYLNRERAAFAAGTSVLLALAHENPANVRGILGGLINTVIG